MAEFEPLPPPPNPASVAAPINPVIVRGAAEGTLSGVAKGLEFAMNGIGFNRTVAESWEDEFWEVSGYDKATVMAAFDALEGLVTLYNEQYKSQADALRTQAAA